MPSLHLSVPQPRNRVALACIVGLHLLAGLLWTQEKRMRPLEAPTMVSILLRAVDRTAPSPARPAPLPPPAPAARAHAAQAAPAVPALPPAVLLAPDASVPATEPDTRAAPDPAPATAAGPSGPGFDMDLLQRRAGRVTRAIAKELPPLPAEPDTKWARFQRDLAAAHVERGNSVREDSYTAPDGSTIYRKRVGGRTLCRMGGSVGVLNMQLMHDQGEARWIPCPKDAQWKGAP
jgi:hypothetical protein